MDYPERVRLALASLGIAIRERLVLHEGRPVTALPNLLGSLAVYRCTAA